ncbi:RapZ C-terminal domain-containing protein [Streptosporangium jomthongense]|uniref:RapZ C-terminal domain-containing protein n=1 Tax=Streptosporangium jomthongense TaxID=1193683 RepID=A0ABV8F4B6_9ACTN
MTAEVEIVSFGYGHDAPPTADITLDVRTSLHDPHVDPAMRQMTGLDKAVQRHVLATRGANEAVRGLASAALGLRIALDVPDRRRPIQIAIGCVGGRHRSVVLAEALADILKWVQVTASVTHRDVAKPVIQRVTR